jgi:hypothetical protein
MSVGQARSNNLLKDMRFLKFIERACGKFLAIPELTQPIVPLKTIQIDNS